jgi:DNA recombination protein RmuC
MPEFALILTCVLLAVAIIILLLVRRSPPDRSADFLLKLELIKEQMEQLDRTLRAEFSRTREAADISARQEREEVVNGLRALADSLQARVAENATLQRSQLDSFAAQLAALTGSNEAKLESVRESVERRLSSLQEDNTRQLERMRVTVDEKLHATLERRLGESFRLVSDRLEQVQLGLGEMKSLATGVGDLKKVLTNVKTRGTWGEVQLGALLEQILTPEQYATNVATRPGSGERVEFAIKLPGKEDHQRHPVWLPIDAKFPQDDYQRLVEAQEQANPQMVEESSKLLETRIRAEAKAIHDKYIDPPHTTDFGILFLPTEGLYAEVLRRPGLADGLQRDLKIMVTGPTTLAALLNSLQMGFRTLAIERRSGEVWTLLGEVKNEFGKFGDVLEKTQKKLQEATNSIEDAGKRTRKIEKKLRQVEGLPVGDLPGALPEGGTAALPSDGEA